MADKITNYKCPACTGPLHFEGTTGKMACDYCGSIFSVEEIEAMFAEQDASAAENLMQEELEQEDLQAEDEWKVSSEEWNENGLKAYTCPSCGAELILDSTTAATACPYCGNTTIVPGQMAGTLKPDCIIPFKLDKDAAVEKLKAYYSGKRLLPKEFSSENHIEEIKGVYVPFWLYDGKAHAQGSYKAEKIRSYEQEGFKVTETDHYVVKRAGDIAFEKIPVDASSKMPDDMMDSIEPYDYKDLTDFSSAYLAGYMADKYDVSAEQNAERAVSRAKQSALSAMQSDVKGYDRVMPEYEQVSVKQGTVSYAMMPVWMLSTKWNDQNFLFAMNGQTGRFVGALPIDQKKATTYFIGIAAILELLMGAYAFFSGTELETFMMVLLFGLIPLGVAALVVFFMKSSMNNVAHAYAASEYVVNGGMNFARRSDRFVNRTETRVKIEQPPQQPPQAPQQQAKQ